MLATTLPHDTVEALPTSTRLVYDYLVSGKTLTNLIALANLGVGSMTSRLSELRRAGLDIKETWAKDHNGSRYKKFWVKEQA
jgi:hypothetical protein